MIRPGSDPEAIALAARALAAGELIGLPTETVYGLAADASSDAAVAKVYAAKKRPADHPLIVHVTDAARVPEFAREVPDFAQRLIDAFWPGPLTLILPRRPDVAAAAAGGQDSIGLRCPAHPVAQAILAAAWRDGVHGVAAPSANRFGRVSPTTAQHVTDELGARLLVIDGGACDVGIESTIVDCTRGLPVLLRPGVLDRAALDAAAGVALHDRDDPQLKQAAPRASGTLASHYAPSARVTLMDADELAGALASLAEQVVRMPGQPLPALYARAPLHRPEGCAGLVIRRMPDGAEAVAHELFAVLRELDALNVAGIWIERPPADAAWDGVRDRLQRAAA
ncbi:MAG: L-threonylcarbamoyladenylate synthase [Comamonas sp.]